LYHPPNGIILDCFAGSGSTGVACANTGRRFIGMELDENYFRIAKERILKAEQEILAYTE
jgi:site-specific DNA-methyltransferase (adenine-specific)